MENVDMGKALDWDAPIENDGADFVVLPAGDYDFEITGFERGRFDGSEKMSACNKAVLSVKVTGTDGRSATITHNLFLNEKCEGILCSFFTSIGQRKKGEKLLMNWNAVVGSKGRCKVSVRTWKNKDGEDMQSNDIKRFYEPASGQPAGNQWKPGSF